MERSIVRAETAEESSVRLSRLLYIHSSTLQTVHMFQSMWTFRDSEDKFLKTIIIGIMI